MKNTRFLVGILMISLVVSCKKKDDTNSVPVYVTYSSLDTIYKMMQVPSKFVSVDGATGGVIIGNSGTKYVIPSGCLQDSLGNSITGAVIFEVAEYLNKGDMIFSRMLPVSNGEPLFSAGEIYINAMQGPLKVYLKPGCTCTASIPQGKTPEPGMSFFAGQAIANPTNNKVNWNNKIDSTGHGFGVVVYNGDSITIISDSLKMCNADRFMTSPDYQSFTVTISASGAASGSDLSQVNAYALYDSYKGVWPLSGISGSVISEGHVPNIPVHFAAFGLINNRFYGGVIAATPATGSNYTLTLFEVSPTDFKAQLNGLTN